MKLKTLATIVGISALAFSQPLISVSATSSQWDYQTWSTFESTFPHSFSGTSGLVTAGGWATTDRSSGRAGTSFSWAKTDSYSGRLKVRVVWSGSNPGDSKACVWKVFRTVKIAGIIESSMPGEGNSIGSQSSGAFWDTNYAWILGAGDRPNYTYSHEDSEERIEMDPLTSVVHFDEDQGGPNYYGWAEIWPYWAQTTNCVVNGPSSAVVDQTTNVKYEVILYSVDGNVLS